MATQVFRLPEKAEKPLLAFLGLLYCYGLYRCFRSGGEDFRVFYHAAELVIAGRAHEIYANSPDRYLYAPGFAWLLGPLALLSGTAGLAVWSLLKFFAFGGMIRILSRKISWIAALAGAVFFIRPLLTELKYGQVNLLIVCAFVWAVRELMAETPHRTRTFVSWFVFAIAAAAKLFPMLLILLPFFMHPHDTARARPARFGVFAGVLLIGILPLFTLGFTGALDLHWVWRDALMSKGFPTETHNQSFLAFLVHTFSDEGFYSLMLGPKLYDYSIFNLPKNVIYGIGGVWSIGMSLAVLVGSWWVARTRQIAGAWALLAACVIPSHLVWKPYFVFAIPLAAYAFESARNSERRMPLLIWTLGAILVNCTSFDFIGRHAAARFEAHATPLWVTVALLAYSMATLRRTTSRVSG